MIYLKIERSHYDEMKTLLPDICPNVEFSLVVADENLKLLGLCSDVPCIVAFDLDKDEFNQMMDELIQLEIDAFNVPGGDPPPDDPDYQRYIKYGWMWDVLFDAEEIKTAE